MGIHIIGIKLLILYRMSGGGRSFLHFVDILIFAYMIDKAGLTKVVEDAIKGTDMFLVDIRVSADNRIVVELDSESAMDVDTCAAVARRIESEFDRDAEDYELEVGSAGITSPFKVKAQYMKNLGNEIEVVTRDGRKLQGTLASVGADDFTVEIPTKVKHEGAKRPVIEMQPSTIAFDNVKTAKYVIKFK